MERNIQSFIDTDPDMREGICYHLSPPLTSDLRTSTTVCCEGKCLQCPEVSTVLYPDSCLTYLILSTISLRQKGITATSVNLFEF